MNPGKMFEQDFAKSAPEWLEVIRLVDSGGWGKADELRFTPSNICDFIAFSEKTHRLYKLELKSVAGKSLPFGNINKKKLDKLCEKVTFLIQPSIVINYRKVNQTYLIPAREVQAFMNLGERKSVPLDWADEYGTIIIQTLKRVRYKYDLEWL